MTVKKPIQPSFDEKSCRHILSLSGGKDSTALALYMRDRVPNLEYVFCDTEKELKETYNYLEKLEVHLGKAIQRIRPDIGFDDLLEQRRNFLPSPQVRWCTEYLKIRPFERFIGTDQVVMYVGIRADEPHRKGYISTKPNIHARLPFVEDGLRLKDVMRILEDSKLGIPEYYKWRSRSGCFFCFYQQRREWVGLLETHPGLFKKAMKYERKDPVTGEMYTWVQGESLSELADPKRVAQIKADYEKRRASEPSVLKEASLLSVFEMQCSGERAGCVICHL
ncbi:MAG: phosphoadenosine phosphosulfate reductase family protein [Kiritimatiellae bacterium]|nr:phosphoadenosine phosphosulfate reductase family protein [Kiritimatiellia bacterium]